MQLAICRFKMTKFSLELSILVFNETTVINQCVSSPHALLHARFSNQLTINKLVTNVFSEVSHIHNQVFSMFAHKSMLYYVTTQLAKLANLPVFLQQCT